jgi:hypothetical protein
MGPAAEILAGGQYAEGTMYYFFLKPELTSQYPLPASSKSGAAPTAKSSKQAGVKPSAPAPAPASPK